MKKNRLISDVDHVRKERPDLSVALDRALLGPSEKGPTRRFIEVARLARQGVWGPIETLLNRDAYREPTAETAEQVLVLAKQQFYVDLRPALVSLAVKLAEGEFIVAGYQNRIFEATTYQDLMQVSREVTQMYLRECLKSELNYLFAHYAYSSRIMLQLVVIERMLNGNRRNDLSRIKTELERVKQNIGTNDF